MDRRSEAGTGVPSGCLRISSGVLHPGVVDTAIVYALGTAFFLALRDIFGRMAMRGIDPVLGTAATAFTGLVVLTCAAVLNGDLQAGWPGWGWPLFMIGLAGVLRITVGRTTLFTAIQYIGATRGSSFSATNVFFALFLGVFLLKEDLTVLLTGGAVLVVGGCVLVAMSRSRGGATETWTRYAAGMTLALGSALAMALSAALTRLVVHEFSSPLGANFYASLIALPSFLPAIRNRPLRSVVDWPARSWSYLWLVGLVSAIGTTCGYFALRYAPVVVVQPIAQSRPLFVLLVSWIFLQVHESINWKVTAGALAIVLGTALILVE